MGAVGSDGSGRRAICGRLLVVVDEQVGAMTLGKRGCAMNRVGGIGDDTGLLGSTGSQGVHDDAQLGEGAQTQSRGQTKKAGGDVKKGI